MTLENLEYHSEQEKYFHQRHPNLLYNSKNKPFDITFKDHDGEAFQASGDFYDMNTGYWIELKSHALNKHQVKHSANDAKASALAHARSDKTRNQAMLNHGWNHSVFKQQIVQKALKAKGINYAVIFTDSTKLTFRSNGDINTMKNINLLWLYEKQYFSIFNI